MSSKKKKKKKENKRAFTLVELLAVIVILGLLLGITIPAVSKYINETREDTYSLHEANMKLAANNLMSQCEQNDTENCIPESGNSRVVYLSELIDGQYSSKLKDPADTDNYCSEDESYVVVTNVGDGYDSLEYSVCLKCSSYSSEGCGEVSNNSCSQEDTKEPECGEAVGESTLWTNQDRVISIGCSDTDCGCTQSKYYKTFTETATTGTITIKDKAGNKKDCTVNVYVDKTKPTCTLTVTGTIGENDWYGGTAPIVTLASYVDGEGESGVATFGLGTSKTNYNFDKVTTYTVSEGITTVYGYVKDNAGNVGTCSVEVKYDNTNPTEDTYYGYQVYQKEDMTESTSSQIKINSNNALKSGSNILSEYGNIYGIYVYPTSNHPGMTVTVNGETRTISEGITTPTYIAFDSAFTGNSLTIDVSNNRVQYISKIEVVTKSTTGYYTNKNVTLYIHSHDSLSGKAYYSFDNGSNWSTTNYKNYSSNTGSLTLKTKDTSGNINTGSSMNINNIDKVAPTCTVIFSGSEGSNNWFVGDVTVSLTKSDSDSGVRYYGVSTSGLTYDNSDKAQTSDTSGTEWTGYVIDKAGNTATCSATVKKDATAPTCTNSGDSTTWTKNDRTINYGCSDSGSGCNSSYSGGSKKFTTTTKTSVIDSYTIKDNAGNETTCESRTANVYVDKTAPTCTNSGDSTSWTKNDRTINYGCSDSDSGCNSSYSGGSKKFTTTTKTSVIDSYTIKDNAGNETTCESRTADVYVDKTNPSCTNSGDSTSWTKNNRTIYYGCSDSDSGCNSSYSGGSTTFSTTTKTSTINSYKIKDNAGNETTCSSRTANVYVDKTAPSCTYSGDSTSWTTSNRTITIGCSDSDSGCDSSNSSYSKTFNSNTQTASVSYTIKDNVGNSTSCSKTVNVYVDKCTSTSTSTSCGSYGSCSVTCGGGTQTRTCTTTTTSTFSGTTCSTDSYTEDATCNTQSCKSVCDYSDSEFFGSSAGSISGNTTYSATPSSSSWGNWCHASGGPCNASFGYDRICVGSSCAEAGVYGWNVKTINNTYGCSYANYWCSC